MENDFKLVQHKLPDTQPHVNVYPIGDLHVGSPNFNKKSFKRWKDAVTNDPYAKSVMVGDRLETGLQSSHTNSYDATLSPRQQKEFLLDEFAPLKDKVIGAVQGNHEHRSTIMVDSYPLFEVLDKLDIGHVYRKNMCFVKVNVGRRTTQRQCSYTLVLAHGGSSTKTKKFSYAIDGMDAFITGHIHSPDSAIPTKIVIDNNNGSVGFKDFVHLVVPSYQELGGYTLRGMYTPQSSKVIPVLRLSGTEKHMSVIWDL